MRQDTTATILYGVRSGNEDWQEEIITTNPDQLDAATEWALDNGFDRLRIAIVDLSINHFASTHIRKLINI